MGLFDKFKKKQSLFIHDDKYNEFHVEINGIKFICENVEDNYEKLAQDLSNAYESKISDIVNFISVGFGSLSAFYSFFKKRKEHAVRIPERK